MRFYRSLAPIAAMTFDLDDTLYDNRPVIERTEQASFTFLKSHFSGLCDLSPAAWLQLRQTLRAQHPDIYHDVTQWRWLAVCELLKQHGYSTAQCHAGADEVMAHFAYWRNQVDIPQQTHQVLSALAAKIPIAAITNGNADPVELGLADYFQFVLRAGPSGRAKPFADMYHCAAKQLHLPVQAVLHVGDDLTTDVTGALRSGMQACWVNDRAQDLLSAQNSRLLPHLEISQLDSLTALI